MKTILGIFTDRGHAEEALADLNKMGYPAKDISVVVRDGVVSEGSGGGSNIAAGAVSGATTGGVLGGLAGLLVGIGAIALPGVGALFIGGPLAAALGLTGAAAATVSGAATGVLAGGLVGVLVGLGVPEEDAKTYESRIREGAVLLAAPIRDDIDHDAVRETFETHGADKIRTVSDTV